MFMHATNTLLAGSAHLPSDDLQKPGDAPARVIAAVLALLDEAGISYCIPHGWEGLPEVRGSDVDIIVSRDVSRQSVLQLLTAHAHRLGATLACANGWFLTLCCRPPGCLPVYLNFDFATDYAVGPCLVAHGEALLANRRRYKGLWVPSASTGFAARLARGLLKRNLDAASAARLSCLFNEDPEGATSQLAVLWPERRVLLLKSAAASGDWTAVFDQSAALRAELRRRLLVNAPGHALRTLGQGLGARAAKLVNPPGISVVLLGPDGAGKSSTIAALETALAPLFARSDVRGFAPTLRQALRRPPRSTSTPHALKPRALTASLLRAAWWSIYGMWNHAGLRIAKARSTLVLHDRHFIDILVDPVRYRYGGPRWLLTLLCRLMPRADLVVLLDGPAAVLQARKKELTVAETERQLSDYRTLVAGISSSRIVDATQPFEDVVGSVADLIVARLSRKPAL